MIKLRFIYYYFYSQVKRCRKLVADDKVEAYVEAEEEFSNLIASAGLSLSLSLSLSHSLTHLRALSLFLSPF